MTNSLNENQHGYCPNCNVDLDGGSIWETFYDQNVELGHEGAVKRANEISHNYGATKDKGKWGRQIGAYSMEKDRTVAWKCPDCDHEWKR